MWRQFIVSFIDDKISFWKFKIFGYSITDPNLRNNLNNFVDTKVDTKVLDVAFPNSLHRL